MQNQGCNLAVIMRSLQEEKCKVGLKFGLHTVVAQLLFLISLPFGKSNQYFRPIPLCVCVCIFPPLIFSKLGEVGLKIYPLKMYYRREKIAHTKKWIRNIVTQMKRLS